jgi:hypothetical protein
MRILLATLFCLFFSMFEPTVAPIISGNPSMSAAVACDEFHGDYNCTCQESIFNPCCPWWKDKSEWDASCFPNDPKPQPIVHRGVSQADKDRYTQDAEKFKTGAKYFAAMAATAALFGKDEVQEVIFKLSTTAAVLATWAQYYFEGLAKDPPVENWWEAYDAPVPSAEELGLEYYYSADSTAGAYYNWLVDLTRMVYRNGDGAYESLNRSGTCEIENYDCGQWQADLAYDYILALGDQLMNAGYAMAVLRDQFMYVEGLWDPYSPEIDAPLSWVLDRTSPDFWDAGYYLMTR